MFPIILVGSCFVLAAFMAWLAWNLDERQQAFKFFYFGLCLTFLVFGTWQVSFLAYQPDVKLNYTTEDSRYWDCNETVTTDGNCEGTVSENACLPYTETQCNDIAGCVWSIQAGCSGTPTETCEWLGLYDDTGFKCAETEGCVWEPGELITTNASCDSVNVTYVYGNYSSGYEEFGNSMSVLATALMFVMLLLLLYIILTYAGSVIGRMDGKPPGNDFVDNEYGRPY